MPPTKRPAASSTLRTELLEFARNNAETRYEDLPAVYAETWVHRLLETGTTPMPDGMVLVHFDLHIGHDAASLEYLDSLTMRMPAGQGPVSLAARVAATQTVIYLVSGRLPPPAVMPMAGNTPQPDGRNVQVEMEDTDVELPRSEVAPKLELSLDLVASTEPDGLPILRDLYAIGANESTSASATIERLLDVVYTFMERASAEQVNAFAVKNADALEFVKDMGSAEQKDELMRIVSDRRRALAVLDDRPTPRRRSVAAH